MGLVGNTYWLVVDMRSNVDFRVFHDWFSSLIMSTKHKTAIAARFLQYSYYEPILLCCCRGVNSKAVLHACNCEPVLLRETTLGLVRLVVVAGRVMSSFPRRRPKARSNIINNNNDSCTPPFWQQNSYSRAQEHHSCCFKRRKNAHKTYNNKATTNGRHLP